MPRGQFTKIPARLDALRRIEAGEDPTLVASQVGVTVKTVDAWHAKHGHLLLRSAVAVRAAPPAPVSPDALSAFAAVAAALQPLASGQRNRVVQAVLAMLEPEREPIGSLRAAE